MTLVADTSALIELLLVRPLGSQVAQHLARHEDDLHGPHLLDVEVLSTLRRKERAQGIADERARLALGQLRALPIRRYPHRFLLEGMWRLRSNVSAHDATYLALAEALSERTVLLTADGGFARAARTHSAVDVLLVA